MIRRTVSVSLLAVFMAGCAGVSPRSVNEEFKEELAFRKNAYHLKAGDVISLHVMANTEFTEPTLTVTEDGYIDALLGRFYVAGKTIPEVQELITNEQSEFAENVPKIVVQTMSLAPEMVYVGGQVRGPAQVPLLPGMTALEAILSVGGELPTRDFDSVILIRRTSDWERAVRVIDLEILEEDLVLLPRDIVYVPRHTVAKIANFLDQHVYQLLPLSQFSYASRFMLYGGF